MRIFCVLALLVTAAPAIVVRAQVQTEVPPTIPGAKPVKVERIKVHGTALEGNLEGQGTHTSKVAERFQNRVLPFFSRTLCFQAGCR
ncbi:MAG TPA: hypothetical protein VN256_20940 [Pyrinomonadaceae bacterium]|nr:hypothetical protein [Pyrinomonadaceae bacterium]